MRTRLLGPLLLLTAPALAQGHEDVLFQLQHAAAPGAAVFVEGDLDELGGGDPLASLWTSSPDGLSWSVTASLPLGRTYRYRFVERPTAHDQIGDPANVVRLTGWTTAQTSPVPAPARKTVQALTTIVGPRLRWSVDGAPFRGAPLIRFGPGRVASEGRYLAPDVAVRGRRLTFFLEGADGKQRDPAVGAYVTELDDVWLQDGALFAYRPAPFVTPGRGDYDPDAPHAIASTILGAVRHYRVRLPRGYDQHPERSYPVLYQYDGQWLWEGGGQFGFGVYDPGGARMSALVDAGALAEVIQVGVDFPPTDDFTEMAQRRWLDCGPPEDKVGGVKGQGRKFLRFLKNELKPVIDAAYRTRPEPEHTFLQGYSFGGILATYAAWEFDDVFGGVGAQSPSLVPQYIANFLARLAAEPRRAARMHLDVGDEEFSLFLPVVAVVNDLLGKAPPYVAEGDLTFRVGHGHAHTYDRAADRLDAMGGLLFPATREVEGLFVGARRCVGTPNSTGAAAIVLAEGALDPAAPTVTLAAARLPAGTFGRFLVGDAAADLPGYGGGLGRQCVGGVVLALDVRAVDGAGVLRDAPDWTGLVAPGRTLHVQAWYRDGGSSNTSDALALTFDG